MSKRLSKEHVMRAASLLVFPTLLGISITKRYEVFSTRYGNVIGYVFATDVDTAFDLAEKRYAMYEPIGVLGSGVYTNG